MAKIKKFGTFSGVFTPSILTILGVIMYLRFPAIIGQAGLINTIGIIVIAHIISITTSLSVASLSTDKPVQNGGTYFMISRSLGLPIGGTLGLALFVGLSFSVSLYLIGFAESFLQYWGFENNIHNIRIAGSIVLFAVTTITFISTSLAIKSQYFIMVAIGLSLLSILFGHHEFTPTKVNFAPLATSAPFMLLFGIFFPAVTGFEAGVSMSGDLKDPKKSLPVGAIMAVLIGFVVYIGLAFFYAYTVDANALANDPQILFKISLVPALVIAGIWGATLSSALGSILGAPRILQAIAMDKIAPKFLAKGTGKTNEPRNALILAFLIAEAGILIGELDVIARIVSMFFITTYAFLNLASAIESWSSSDFRPAFKIPKFVSILGALSAFIVMILLDFLALAGATIVLGLLYFFLQRKELILESGDTWGSFWSNMAKRSLLKLSIKKDNTRNWRPNIVLFSGGENVRPHLVEMGLTISGKLGALTDFNLVKSDINIPKKAKIDEPIKDKKINYFLRQLACDSVEEGIKSVTSVYGFSGFEPNTVLLGWSKQIENENFLVHVLQDLKSKNMNVIFLDYDKEKGFGKKEHIDIWWNGKGRFLSFALNLLKFLQSSYEWRDAHVRLLIINSDSSLNDSIYRNTSALLNEQRLKIEIKILSDDFGSRTKEDIIHSESTEADLVILGMSPKDSAHTNEYIQTINKLTSRSSSLLLLRPSNEFEEINLIDTAILKVNPILKRTDLLELPALHELANHVIKGRLENLDREFMVAGEFFADTSIHSVLMQLQAILGNIREFSSQNKSVLTKELEKEGKRDFIKLISRNHHSFLRQISNLIHEKNTKYLDEAKDSLSQGLNALFTKLGNIVYEVPKTILVNYQPPKQKKEKTFDFQYRKKIEYYIKTIVYDELIAFTDSVEEVSLNQLMNIRKILFEINDSYEKLMLAKEFNRETILSDIDKSIDQFNKIEDNLNEFKLNSNNALFSTFRKLVNKLAIDIETPPSLWKSVKKSNKQSFTIVEQLNAFAEEWGKGMHLLNNTLYLDMFMLTKKDIAINIISSGNEKIQKQVIENLIQPIQSLSEILKKLDKSEISKVKLPAFSEEILLLKYFDESFQKVSENIESVPKELIVPELIYHDSKLLHLLEYTEYAIYPYKLASYHIDISFREPFYRDLEKLKNTVDSAIIELKEVCSLILFHLNNIDAGSDYSVAENKNVISIYDKLLSQVESERKKVELELEKVDANSTIYIDNTFSKLFYHSIAETEKSIRTERRGAKGKRLNLGIFKQTFKIKSSINSFIVYLINSTSSGLLLSKKYLSNPVKYKSQTKDLLDFVENLAPDKKIYQTVPVFYKSLMSSNSKINDELWIPRKQEMKSIKDALQRHKNGVGGAIIINGLHGAGKTALSRYASQHLFKKNNQFWLNALSNGSTNTNDFLKELQKQFAGFQDLEAIFENMPYDSVLVINDLELWWERRPGGGDVIFKIIELIKLYGHKVFFILNCNSHMFTVLKNIFPIENNIIGVVNCEPFNAKELHQLILRRHKSSGISLNYIDKSEDELTQLNYSILFNTYFNIADGNPGIALNTWNSNIINYANDSISIQKPIRPNKEVISQIESEWILVISLFIQHKNLAAEKLSRILNIELGDSENLLIGLSNAGIIKKDVNVFTLDRYIEPYLVEHCQSIGII